MNKKFAFISAHYHPQSDNTLKILKESFPEYHFDIIRIVDIVKANKKIAILNIYHTLKEYGWEILLRKKHFKQVFFRTVYIFR